MSERRRKSELCGICGALGLADLDLVRKMTATISHRGPDNQSFFVDEGVSLGVSRLSIIDPVGGNQPIFNEDKSMCIVYNGEIYNYQEARSRLEKRHTFTTACDTEVVVHLYEEFGERCLEHLRGMFAFAIWDSRKRALFLARDRLGIKPLYYCFTRDDTFLFASEIKSILATNLVERKISIPAVADLFHYFYLAAPLTMIPGVINLPPAHYLKITKEEHVMRRYWDVRLAVEPNAELDSLASSLKDLLRESVREHLVSDVPISLMLSGGVDSSSVAVFARQFYKGPIEAFTFGLSDDGEDLKYAGRLCEKVGLSFSPLYLEYEPLIEDFQRIIWHMEEPVLNTSLFPTYVLAREIAKSHKVVILGEGADELFAGYGRYRLACDPLPGNGATGDFDLARSVTHGVLWGVYSDDFRRSAIRDEIGHESAPNGEFSRDLAALSSISPPGESLNRALVFDLKYELPDMQLIRIDRLTMAHGLEARVPFLSHPLVEYAMRVPSKYKLSGGVEKLILRKSLETTLPAEINYRKKKAIRTPILSWWKTNLAEYVEGTLDQSRSLRPIFNQNWLNATLQRAKQESVPDIWTSLLLTQIAVWSSKFIEDSAPDSTRA